MTYHFDPNASFIAVEVDIEGPVSLCRSVFALDTGATQTVVDADLLSQLGYDATQAIRAISATIVGGQTTMTEYKLSTFSALGADAKDFIVSAVKLRSPRFDGLLGKDFFRDRELKIDFRNGTIELS